jgi:hypothetical protein
VRAEAIASFVMFVPAGPAGLLVLLERDLMGFFPVWQNDARPGRSVDNAVEGVSI